MEALPFVPAALSIGSAIFGGDSAPSAPNVNVYQPTGTGQQDANLQGLLNSNTNFLAGHGNPYDRLNPQILQAWETLFNSPGASGYANASQNAGGAYQGVGGQSLMNSSALSSAALAGLPMGQQVANLGLDPQSALKAQLEQGVIDRANVTNAQYGLKGQQAASSVNQADLNFNNEWQSQQLARALQGLGGYNQSVANLGTAATTAQNVGGAGAGSILTGGAAPYQADQTIGGNQETALAQLIAQMLGPITSSQSTIGDLSGYLNSGINASASGNSAGLNSYYAGLQGASGGSMSGLALGNALSSAFNTQATPSGGSLPWQQPGYGSTWGYGSGF